MANGNVKVNLETLAYPDHRMVYDIMEKEAASI